MSETKKMNKKSRFVAYIAMAVLMVAFVACTTDSEGVVPGIPTAEPTQPAVVPTQPPVNPTIEPTKIPVQPTPPVAEPTQPADVENASVSGTVTYLQRIALGPNAIVIVRLLDVSRADAPSVTLGERIIENPGQVPVPFEIEYDPTNIDGRFTYVVRAEIRDDGKLIFTTTSSYPVITRGSPNEVELVLQIVSSPTQPVFENEIALEYNFETDDEGWTTGFADLPANWTPDTYELESGYRNLPSGLEGSGIYLQGHNRSDDLFMYLTKHIDGLKPLADYQIEFSIDLVTNVPGGMMGIGGSPGESVYVKAGAAPSEPVVAPDSSGHLLISVDKGHQSNAGSEMINIGNVAHPEVLEDEYKVKTLDNARRPLTVSSDADGGLWLIVGTDSGFEGLSQLYYSRIRYQLTIVE